LVAIRAELVLSDLGATPVAGDGVDLELHVEPTRGDGPALHASISEQCAVATLEAGVPDAAVPVRRVVDLTDVPPEARVRTLAVALAELIRTTRNAAEAAALRKKREELASLAERLERSAPSPAPEPPPAPPENEREVVLLTPGHVRVGVGGLVTLGFSGPGQSLVGELGANLGHSRTFRWSLEASYARSSVDTPFGDLRVQRWALALGGDFGFAKAKGLLIGPRIVGLELLGRGRSKLEIEEDQQSGPGLGLGLRVSFEVPVTHSVFLKSTLDAGAAVWSMTFTAGGRQAFAYDGLQAAWGIGVGWNL
jgi:hypothetical protein